MLSLFQIDAAVSAYCHAEASNHTALLTILPFKRR